MNKTLKNVVIALIAPYVVGCHVAHQALEALTPKDTTNILKQQDIIPLTALQQRDSSPRSKHEGEILALKAPGGPSFMLLSIGLDGRIIGWNAQSGQGHELKHLKTSPKVAAIGATKALVAWGDEQGIFVTCIQSCSARRELANFKVRPSSLAFQDGDSTLLIGGSDGRVYRWRFLAEQEATGMAEREKMVERYMGHHTMVSGVVAHPLGRAFFSSDWDGALLGWLTYTADDNGGHYDKNQFRGRFYTDLAANVSAPRAKDRGISSLAISRDGEHLAVGTDNGFVEVWSVRGFVLAARESLHQGRVTAVALSDDGTHVASVGKDSKVRIGLITPNPAHTLSPSTPPKLLQKVSEHHIPSAKGAVFSATNKLAVSTTTGEVAEVRFSDPPKALQSAPARPTPLVAQDEDY